MCLAIAFKGDDLLYGFNLDLDLEVWQFSVHKKKDLFAIGITVGKTTYYVHGINKNGNFGNVPYMNAKPLPAPKGVKRERIDLLNDRYIRGKYSFKDVEKIVKTKTITGIPQNTMHSLIGNKDGKFLLVEQSYGYKKIKENYAAVANFPLLTELEDYSSPYLGLDRYDKAIKTLSKAKPDFSVKKALKLLYDTQQKGKWATRLSFVYSQNENKVYYFLNGDLNTIQIHKFE